MIKLVFNSNGLISCLVSEIRKNSFIFRLDILGMTKLAGQSFYCRYKLGLVIPGAYLISKMFKM